MPFKFNKLAIKDVIQIEPVKFKDDRGFFEEVFKLTDFKNFGININIKQINFSHSTKGVLRGLHYQLAPFAQAKLIRVVSGAIFDVAVDLRKGSPTFAKWVGVILNSNKESMLYIPEGFAHGFEVLSDTVDFEYFCSNIYSPENERGIMYNDKTLNITWSCKNPIISAKDLKHLPFAEAEYNFEYIQTNKDIFK
ncbi:dTDP-4-dehydrorhamnose 3,5-epimerase [Candidatus Ruminimicrobium bovinum]|uniref:dTDP-4-dehydrorhamnose 3,5-epimerase n=1 Tax=Candidatus Ruminimicrobium bovinum TaxID=3242779 RepID=UPI0039B83CE0